MNNSKKAAFAYNTADSGGAIYLSWGEVFLKGGISFTNNSAYLNGGADLGSTGSVAFVENAAKDFGGALHLTSYGKLQVSNTTFRKNVADVGGAVFIAGGGNTISEFSACMFDANIATDGGAMYLYTGGGTEIFTSSVFRYNFARVAGGAIFHTGHLRVANSSFFANRAGADGPAVMSIGPLERLSNVFFSENAHHCRAGKYGYIKKEDEACTGCFDEVCARCLTESEDVTQGDGFHIDGLAVCEETPPGATARSSGTTLETLILDKGYYRTSNSSHVVLECYQTHACLGGTAAESTCAVGFRGPYCAVCAEGFARGIAYSCHECSESRRNLAVGISAVVGFAVVLAAAVLLRRLGSVGMGTTGEETEVVHSCWGQDRRSCQIFSLKPLPLTAIKIVVTVWQIVYQFAAIAGDVYPEVYANFIFKLTPVNLDIGFMLSYSCIVTLNFYDRLVIATIVPPLFLVTLMASYLIGKKRNRTSEVAIILVKHRHQSAALLLAFWVYSSVSYAIFQTFSCDELDDGKAYLRADYSLECSTTLHSTFKTYSSAMMCIYTVGIPAVFALCLARNRVDLAKPDRGALPHLQSLSALCSAYKPARYWFELVECARRIILTGIAAFVLPNSTAQISIVLLVAVVFVFISETLAPFEAAADANLYRWGNGVIVASLYVAFLLKVDLADESEESITAFSGVLIAANVVMVVAVFVQTVLLMQGFRGVRTSVRAVDAPVRRVTSL